MLAFIKFNLQSPYVEYPLIITTAIVCAYILSFLVRNTLARLLELASETLKIDGTRFNFVKNASSYIIYTCFTIWVCAVIPPLRHLGDTFFAGAGILAAIVGFASQQAFSNIVSGIFIVIFKPFRVGDSIKIGVDVIGTIEDITLRHVIIRNLENKRIIIPNTMISSQIIVNSTIVDEKVLNMLDLIIEHKADANKAMQIMQESVINHPKFLDGRSEEAIEAGKPLASSQITNISEAGIHLRTSFWTQTAAEAGKHKAGLFKTILENFATEGIEFAKTNRAFVK